MIRERCACGAEFEVSDDSDIRNRPLDLWRRRHMGVCGLMRDMMRVTLDQEDAEALSVLRRAVT